MNMTKVEMKYILVFLPAYHQDIKSRRKKKNHQDLLPSGPGQINVGEYVILVPIARIRLPIAHKTVHLHKVISILQRPVALSHFYQKSPMSDSFHNILSKKM